MQKRGVSLKDAEEFSERFNDLLPIAIEASNSVPSIGFLSANKRIMAFLCVCDVLDKFIEKGEIRSDDSQVIIGILLFKNKKFLTAAGQFQTDAMLKRFDARTKSEMPRSAREWLAGIEHIGY